MAWPARYHAHVVELQWFLYTVYGQFTGEPLHFLAFKPKHIHVLRRCWVSRSSSYLPCSTYLLLPRMASLKGERTDLK